MEYINSTDHLNNKIKFLASKNDLDFQKNTIDLVRNFYYQILIKISSIKLKIQTVRTNRNLLN